MWSIVFILQSVNAFIVLINFKEHTLALGDADRVRCRSTNKGAVRLKVEGRLSITEERVPRPSFPRAPFVLFHLVKQEVRQPQFASTTSKPPFPHRRNLL